jgi:Fic family protein
MKELLNQIDALKKELDRLKPLPIENAERLWRKFRLEWNYNSNHIEGNTLTYGETYLLLIKGDVTGDHKAQEIDEMRAHDVVVMKVQEYALDKNRALTESDIREWNKIILVRPFWKEAVTADGQATQKLIEPGRYKTSPNSVRLANGEMFHYTSVEETPALMKELMDWVLVEENTRQRHPAELAALFHYKFVRIHPFDDGNGRVARLLMNYVLLRHEFPPVVVKSADKRNYLAALSKADAGDLNSFVEYIAEQAIWSLEISLKAARGESIEELDDIYKEIKIWKGEFDKNAISIKKKDIATFTSIGKGSILTLFKELLLKHSTFDEVFLSNEVKISDKTLSLYYDVLSANKISEEILSFLNAYAGKSPYDLRADTQLWKLWFTRSGLKKDNTRVFVGYSLNVEFHYDYYQISFELNDSTIELAKNHYGIDLNEMEIQEIAGKTLKEVFQHIQKQESF